MSKPTHIIAIGASAGGLEAISILLSTLNNSITGVCLVIAQHLSPTYKSRLVELLQRETLWKVKEVNSGDPIESGIVYVTPPDANVFYSNEKLFLQKPEFGPGPKPSVDFLFSSLAKQNEYKAIAVILSGTGMDGSDGIRELKASGGITFCQNPEEAKYDGMPKSSIESRSVDFVLNVNEIIPHIKKIIDDPEFITVEDDFPYNPSTLERILKLLTEKTGTDFSNYKPSTILRRVTKRQTNLSLSSIESYLEYISKNPIELDALFASVLIGVTSFFRDEEAFQTLEEYLEKIIQSKTSNETIRVWVAGCATGEEPYTIALILYKLLKNRINEFTVQIFATDIDENALSIARKGIYHESSLRFVPEDMKKEFFLRRDKTYELIKPIRNLVLFSKHDLTSNPPFLRLDLISCRNLLIYFGASLQKNIFPIFHYGLNNDGLLFLGKSESIGQFTDLFLTLDNKHKIFQKRRTSGFHTLKFNQFRARKVDNLKSPISLKDEFSLVDNLKESIYKNFEYPFVIVNESMDIVLIQGEVSPFLKLSSGSMSANILKLASQDTKIELRAILTKAIQSNKPISGRVTRRDDNSLYRMKVKIITDNRTGNNLFMIIYEDFGFLKESFLISDNERDSLANSRVIELEKELSATKEHLQSFVEELETSNEELQSLNEELQSANEELQSSNEELETSNEELQSTNEEIQVAYTELKAASEALERKEKQLEESSSNLKAIFENSIQAFLLIDSSYRILISNELAKEIKLKLTSFPLKDGESILHFFPESFAPKILENMKSCFENNTVIKELAIESYLKQIYWYRFNFVPIRSENQSIKTISISLKDFTIEKTVKEELEKKERLISSIFDSTESGICVTDDKGFFVKVNQGYLDIYGYSYEEIIGRHFTIVVPEEYRGTASNLHDDFIESGIEIPREWTVVTKNGDSIKIYVSAKLMTSPDGAKFKVTTIRKLGE
ncbi:MAG: CheR family methyltransferase [Leptospiraceae bacterium]|nr:CheR family methyltransferase [Leptospiraceae bacterium]